MIISWGIIYYKQELIPLHNQQATSSSAAAMQTCYTYCKTRFDSDNCFWTWMDM